MSDRPLKLACFNCNSVNLRSNEIHRYLHDRDIDIMLLTETHLASGISYRGRPKGYEFFRADHPSDSCRGGTGLLIRRSVKFYYDPNLDVSTDNIQAVGVSVSTKSGEIFIASVYCPPNETTKREEFADLFEKLPKRFILAGDFNAKSLAFGCRAPNPRGKELLQAINDIHANVVTDGFPTYYPKDHNRKPDLLDFFISRNVSRNYLAVGSEIEMNSDHIPIKLAIYQSVILKRRNKITNAKTDWDLFRSILNEEININPIVSISELEEESKNVAEAIISAATRASPIIKYTNTQLNLPPELRNLITERRRARAKFQKSRFYKDRQHFEKINRITTTKISEFREEQNFNYLKELTPTPTTDYSLWKATKYLKKSVGFSQPLKKPDGQWTKTHQEKTDEFCRHLSEVFKPHEHIISDIDIEAEKAKIIPSPPEEIGKVSTTEVADTIKYKVKVKKSPGLDEVTGDMLKNLPKKAIRKIADIYNAIFKFQFFPSTWKMGEVILIHKKGKPAHLASSHRPITLLSILGKIFERLLLNRLMPIIDERKILPKHQFGFRKRHSTVEQIHRITNLVENCFEHKMICSVALLDIAQAFDKVWLAGLAFKLLKLLPINYYILLTSYLYGRSFRVRHEDTYSKFMPIEASVPQGSCLGPVLFLLYMYDLPKVKGTRVSTFADDTARTASRQC